MDLRKRVKTYDDEVINDIVIEFDASEIGDHGINFIAQLPDILKDSGEIGKMEYDIFKLEIKSLETHEKDLIICTS